MRRFQNKKPLLILLVLCQMMLDVYTRRLSRLFPFTMPICAPRGVFWLTSSVKLTNLCKTKGQPSGSGRTRGGSPEPRTRSVDRCAAADAAAVAAEAASCRARGLPTMGSDDEPKEHKHHQHKRKPV